MSAPPTGPAAHQDLPTPLGATTGTGLDMSWEEIVRLHRGAVYRVAYRLTGNPHDAEDLAQDVFVRAHHHLHTFIPGNLQGWLYRITVNLFTDRWRRDGRVRLKPLREDAAIEWLDPEQLVTDRCLEEDLHRALVELHPDYRAAVMLRDVQGLSYEEIAAVLGIKYGTVGSRIHRGHAALRVALAHREPTRRRPTGGPPSSRPRA